MSRTPASNVRTLRVAAVQRQSQNGKIEANLAAAARDVEEAARCGARLVLLPELLAAGYSMTRALWNAAEPKHGPTARWLSEQSRRHGVYLGASFLEAEGDDFFNTFVLTTPRGDEAGRVRKQTPAVFEAFFTRGDTGPHVIETELGRIGVGICYENQLAYMPRLFHEHGVDLILMPHSAPSPPRRVILARAIDLYEEALRTVPAYYANLFGVPVVLTNKSGPWRVALRGLPRPPVPGRFPGLSTIVDSNGQTRAALAEDDGLLVEDVVLDPARKRAVAPAGAGRWSRPTPWSAQVFPAIEAVGRAWYTHNKERRARARAIAGG